VSRVAVVTCDGDVDPDSPYLLAALDAQGLEASLVAWDDDQVDWDGFDLCVIRSTWDYAHHLERFLAWASHVERLENPLAVLRYSSDKHYLGDLARRGHRVVATTFCDVGEEPVFPQGDFVVKPCVGAGSMDADRYAQDEHARARRHVATLHERGRDVLIQPYVGSVDHDGERALIFVEGEFCHAMRKGAMLNTVAHDRHQLFRREQVSVVEVEATAVSFAREVLASLDFPDLLYARVDLVHDGDGWAIMELELVEPSLFLCFDATTTSTLARAIARRLDAASRPVSDQRGS
jgi:glutathione synthase/RimK-type ligase-like ATP-grasp enzyme